MATFAKSLETKLKTLEASQTGIQTLSLWIIHHKHQSESITNAWVERVKKVNRPEKQLGLFYLANDVVQNGRKKAKDLVTAFGKAFLEVVPLFVDAKTKSQVDRVFNIWIERSVYEPDFVAKLRQKIGKGITVPKIEVKKTPVKQLLKPTKSSSTTPVSSKVVPPDFKVANLLVSIKKTTSLDNETQRKSKKLDTLDIDATNYDSVKHVKNRSSVGKFHKQFDESKIILEGYIHTLKRAEKDKRNLLTLLAGGEAFYALAQDEAKVIVNAYNTFGNRLNSMKKKLDSKIKKMKEDGKTNEQTDSQGHKMRPNASSTTVQDMDLDSESGDEIPSSQAYNPSTAPSHDELPDEFTNIPITPNSKSKQPANNFFDPQSMNGMSTFMGMDAEVLPGDVDGTIKNTDIVTDHAEEGLMMKAIASFTNGAFQSLRSSDHTLFEPLPMHIHPKPSPVHQQQHQPNLLVNPLLVSPRHHQADNNSSDNNPAVQNLIDSLFPVLSKSLQTIKEKTQSSDDLPSVNAAMAFALGDVNEEEGTRKKARFESDPNKAISPVSLTNPKGLSDHQTELINIAAGITEFDENFLPVDISQLSRSQSREDEEKKEEMSTTTMVTGGDDEKKRDDKKHRHRHKSHKDDNRHRRSSSRSPQRRSSHRSSRDSRDERRSDRRRSSRRSPSPKRRSSKGGRSHRSSSRERDEKRKLAPGDKLYYNNRRSPTPEMDSSSQQQQPAQSQQQQQQSAPSQQMISNPMAMPPSHFAQQSMDAHPTTNQQPSQQQQPQQQLPHNQQDDVAVIQQQPPQHQQQGFINPGLVMNQQVFPNPSHESDNNNVGNNDANGPTTPGISQQFQFNMTVGQANSAGPIHLPSVPIIAPHVGFQPAGIRPAPMGLPQRGPNPLQLLQRDDQIQIRPPQFLQDDHVQIRPAHFVQVNNTPPFMAMNHQHEHLNNTLNEPPTNQVLPPHEEQPPQQHQQARIENFPGQFNPPFSGSEQPPPFPGAPPRPPSFMRPEFRPLNPDVFPQGRPGVPEFRPPLNSDIFPRNNPEGMDIGNVFAPGIPDNMNIRPVFENMQEHKFSNRPPFEQFSENQPQFRPRFHNSPGRPTFRPRGGGSGPRHFRPRQPRPVL